MSFGLPPKQEQPRLTYGGYLKVPELLRLQHLESDPPQHDETLFIIIHQVYELWFKQLLHEIDTVITMLRQGQVLAAHRLVRRCIEIERVLVAQIRVLETMTPMDFLTFRDRLMPASGFQSVQFREVEFACGLKDERYLRFFPLQSEEEQRLRHRLAAPTLPDALDALLELRGFGEFLPGHPDLNEQRVQALLRVYQQAELHYDLYLLAESLIEFDEMFMLWRLHHVKMVERMIGSKMGTGGSSGAAYLRSTTDKQFFPALWEVRSYFSTQGQGYGH